MTRTFRAESCNTLEGNGDMVTGKQTNIWQLRKCK